MFRVITDFGIHLWKATSQFSNLSQKFQMPILQGEFVSLTFNEELNGYTFVKEYFSDVRQFFLLCSS